MSDPASGDPFAAPPPPSGQAPPPPPGYAPPPPYPGADPPLSPSDERLWAVLSHLSIFVLSLLGPVLILLILGKRSAFVSDQSKEALNFHITVLIAAIVSTLLCFVIIGFVLLPVVAIGSIVLAIIAAVQANQGIAYRYPLTLRLVS